MANHTPLVTIGIPTYNRPAGLRRILQEITCQTYVNLEIIVSDNHSSGDETETIAREFMQTDRRIRYFRQPENIGSFNNYMFLFNQSQGAYFAWVCDDDFRAPEYVEACMCEFERLESPILINSYSTRLNSQGQVIATDSGCSTIGMPARDRYIKYISTIFTTQAAIGDVLYGIVDRAALAQVLAYQTNIIGWDHVILAHLALNGEFYTIPQVLMSASEIGISATIEQTARAQMIPGSLSEKHPVWVREIQRQGIIAQSPQLNRLEKIYLSLWSYGFYFATHGLKMWVKGVLPGFFAFLKNTRQIRARGGVSSAD
jgi:glycosyltransferase involved in cell wall biosynthesis